MRSFGLLTSGVVIAGMILFLPSRPAARRADPVLVSSWRQASIAIDGSSTDWTKLERLERGPAVSLQNDAESLYLAVATSEPEIRRQLTTGLIVWFDPTSKKVQNSGVRIAGMARRPLPGAAPDAPPDQPIGQGSSSRVLDRFDWLGPGKNQRKLVDVVPALGVAIASGTEEGVLVYEITLPLKTSPEQPYAVGATPASTIAVGLETPNDPPPTREGRGRGPGGGMEGPSGGMGGRIGMGGGMGAPGGGRGDFPGNQSMKPMKLIWISVKLSNGGERN